MKEDNHPWLQNVQYLLFKIGLGDIWLSSGMRERNHIKSIVTERLQDLYIQQLSIITKLRIDMNCTLDSKNRSFRYRNVTTNECTHCKEVQSVEHLLLHCKHPDIDIFYTKYCNPTCSSENKEKAKEAIYMYIKQVYYILDNKMNNIII